MEGSNIRITLVGVLVVVLLVCGCPEYLHCKEPWLAVAHHFYHANIFHLAVNSLSLWTLFRAGQRYSLGTLIVAFLIGSASWFFTSADVIGFSNIIFAIIGLRTPSLRHAWWRHPSVILFLAITALMAFLPQVSAVTHIVSFVFGCIVSGALRVIRSISRDFSRASYNR